MITFVANMKDRMPIVGMLHYIEMVRFHSNENTEK